VVDFTESWFYLNKSLIDQRGLKPAEVEETLARAMRDQPELRAAYTRTQLSAGVAADDLVGQRVARSFHPDRSGDVAVVLQPYHLWGAGGTSHGTPYDYDTHVPLLVFGPSIVGGPRHDLVTPQAVAAILARSLAIKPPVGAKAPVPDRLFAPH
jgi:hypothetical protein